MGSSPTGKEQNRESGVIFIQRGGRDEISPQGTFDPHSSRTQFRHPCSKCFSSILHTSGQSWHSILYTPFLFSVGDIVFDPPVEVPESGQIVILVINRLKFKRSENASEVFREFSQVGELERLIGTCGGEVIRSKNFMKKYL